MVKNRTKKVAPTTGLLPGEYSAMVLLVDDDAIIGKLVGSALGGRPDIDFHFCAKPAEALALTERIKPTVILQDQVLPGIDGPTQVRAYRASRIVWDIPIVVLSAKDEPGTASPRARLAFRPNSCEALAIPLIYKTEMAFLH